MQLVTLGWARPLGGRISEVCKSETAVESSQRNCEGQTGHFAGYCLVTITSIWDNATVLAESANEL